MLLCRCPALEALVKQKSFKYKSTLFIQKKKGEKIKLTFLANIAPSEIVGTINHWRIVGTIHETDPIVFILFGHIVWTHKTAALLFRCSRKRILANNSVQIKVEVHVQIISPSKWVQPEKFILKKNSLNLMIQQLTTRDHGPLFVCSSSTSSPNCLDRLAVRSFWPK